MATAQPTPGQFTFNLASATFSPAVMDESPFRPAAAASAPSVTAGVAAIGFAHAKNAYKQRKEAPVILFSDFNKVVPSPVAAQAEALLNSVLAEAWKQRKAFLATPVNPCMIVVAVILGFLSFLPVIIGAITGLLFMCAAVVATIPFFGVLIWFAIVPSTGLLSGPTARLLVAALDAVQPHLHELFAANGLQARVVPAHFCSDAIFDVCGSKMTDFYVRLEVAEKGLTIEQAGAAADEYFSTIPKLVTEEDKEGYMACFNSWQEQHKTGVLNAVMATITAAQGTVMPSAPLLPQEYSAPPPPEYI